MCRARRPISRRCTSPRSWRGGTRRRKIRTKRSSGGLRALVAKYPNEIEAKTYLALMIMRGFTLPDKKPNYPTSTEAVTMLRQLLKDAPDHPGVHHYVIHGFEGSDFAKDAWPSCKRYAELVPNIPHALHMPGHIWAQTGRWDDADSVVRYRCGE